MAAPTDITTLHPTHDRTPSGAPALVTFTIDGSDPRTVSTIRALTDLVASTRPDLHAAAAFLGGGENGLEAVVARLADAGHDEIVVVPLLLSEAELVAAEVAPAIEAVQRANPSVRIQLTRVLGMESTFFRVLDERLREALAQHRVRELDALVLAGPGSTDPLANAFIARVARAWGKHHHLPTSAAFATAAPPAAGEAVRAHRADGRRHIAVGMAFIAPGPQAARVRELAIEAGAVAVAEPLGVHDEVAHAVLARYAVGAVDLVPLEPLAV